MDTQDRLDLLNQSKSSKKMAEYRQYSDLINSLLEAEMAKVPEKKPFETKDEDNLESQMLVCVRCRPMLEHEILQEYGRVVHTSNPKVLVMEPMVKEWRAEKVVLTNNEFNVDMVFGPEDDNELVFSNTTHPLVETATKGGVATFMAYGQTGSGKTHTVTGIIQHLSKDLFNTNQPDISIHLSFIQILGNTVTDLMVEDDIDNKNIVSVMEDKFGKIRVVGVKEMTITSGEQFLSATNAALARRTTSTTLKNDTSSRFENTAVKAAEDGILNLIDLAGSENASDAQFHDKSRLGETKAINKSLMCLKDCIRNRAKASLDPSSFVHIPYRNSKLTLLLKDAFELESYRQSRTVVVANIAPSLLDLSMTLNTLRYAAPIKQGLRNKVKVEPNPRNPANWDNEKLAAWIKGESLGKLKPAKICPWESGRQFLSLPESEIISRITATHTKMSEEKAKDFYLKLWKVFIDARTRERKKKIKPIKSVFQRPKHQPLSEVNGKM